MVVVWKILTFMAISRAEKISYDKSVRFSESFGMILCNREPFFRAPYVKIDNL